MSIQVFNRFYFVCFFSNLNLIALHNFLYCCSNISQPNIYSCCLYSYICCFPSSFNKWIELWIKCYCKSRIYNPSIYLCSKVYFTHIIVFNCCCISTIWSVMSSNMIQTTSCWESYSLIQSICIYQISVQTLNFIANIN